MKILNLVVVLGVFFGWNISANAAEDDFGLNDVLFEDEENLPPKTDKIVEETQQKVEAEKAKLDEVISDIDSNIPAEKEQSNQEAEEPQTEITENIIEAPTKVETPDVIVKTEENIVIKEDALPENKTDDEKSAETEIIEEQSSVNEESVSEYIKKLDLSDEQLDEAKFISSEMEMRQEQLQKSVDILKAQAREIEEQSLREFEAILKPAQKEVFEKLRQINAQANKEE